MPHYTIKWTQDYGQFRWLHAITKLWINMLQHARWLLYHTQNLIYYSTDRTRLMTALYDPVWHYDWVVNSGQWLMLVSCSLACWLWLMSLRWLGSCGMVRGRSSLKPRALYRRHVLLNMIRGLRGAPATTEMSISKLVPMIFESCETVRCLRSAHAQLKHFQKIFLKFIKIVNGVMWWFDRDVWLWMKSSSDLSIRS